MQLIFDTYGNDKQKEVAKYWIDKTTADIVYGGSKGSGKSYLGVSLTFGDCFLYPGIHYFIARKSLTNIRKFTIPSIHEVFDHWKVPQSMYRYNGQDNYYELCNGSRVYLLDAKYLPSDPLYQRLGSMQMTRGWIEEAGEFEIEAKNNLAASIGRWKNDIYKLPGKLLQTCNPSKNYLYKDYYKKHKSDTLEPYKKFVQALPEDNKRLPPGYIENLYNVLTHNEKERLLYGNWEYDDDPRQLIDITAAQDYFTNEFVKAEGNKYITGDIARKGRDKTIVRVWHGWRVIERHALNVSTIPQSVELIRLMSSKHSIPMSRVIVDEDGVGGGVVDYLRCNGFVNNSRAIGIGNYANLKTQCDFLMAKRISDRTVCEICNDNTVIENTIEEMEQVKQDKIDTEQKLRTMSKEDVKGNIGRSPDEWDSIKMREWFALTNIEGRTIRKIN